MAAANTPTAQMATIAEATTTEIAEATSTDVTTTEAPTTDQKYEHAMVTIAQLLDRVDLMVARNEQPGTTKALKEFTPPSDWGTNYTTMKIDCKDVDYIVCTYKNDTDMHNSVIMHSTQYNKFWTGSNKNQTDGVKNYNMYWQHTKYDANVWEKVD